MLYEHFIHEMLLRNNFTVISCFPVFYKSEKLKEIPKHQALPCLYSIFYEFSCSKLDYNSASNAFLEKNRVLQIY